MNTSSRALKELARLVLSNAHNYAWSLQGMGMLRLHLPNHCRLHVWDSRFRAPGVSMIHDHLQWGLESIIVAGRLVNQRYRALDYNKVGADSYWCATLKPGYGCYFKDEPRDVWLLPWTPEHYKAGMSYFQEPDHIHETDAEDGTVTFMRKIPTDDESARVFWPKGTKWGSAEPRAATPEEVKEITSHALAKWFDSENAA